VIGMIPPIGFVTLYAAVDAVGRTMFGARWQYAVPLSREVDNELDAHERVITLVAEGCEAGAIAAAYQSIAGADDLDRAVWRLPHWRGFFTRGMIDLDLPLLDARGRPDPSGHTARCPREIFVRRDSLERFILNVAPDVASSCDGIAPKRPSRGPKADVTTRVVNEMRRELATEGAERLKSQTEKVIADRYGASRDTIRKARKVVLVETQSKPEIKSSANDK
jgi:hypothetical protein